MQEANPISAQTLGDTSKVEDEIDDLSISMQTLGLSTDNVSPEVCDEYAELVEVSYVVLEDLDRLPCTNLAFTLFCDVVNLYSTTDTRRMRYSEETMKSGRTQMSDMKNETGQLRTWASQFVAEKSRIIFACPDEKVLENINPFGEELPVL